MKKLINLWLIGAIPLLSISGCTGEKTVHPDQRGNASFSAAEMFYYYDDFGIGAGCFGIALSQGDPTGNKGQAYSELYLDFVSDHFPDALKAAPTEGVYTYSDALTRYTFNNDYSWYLKWDGHNELLLGLVGGSFTLERSGDWEYIVNYDLELGDGSRLKGTYKGEIPGAYHPTLDADVDINYNDLHVSGAEAIEIEYGLWAVMLWGEHRTGSSGKQEVVTMLHINTSEDATSLPVGRFLMAEGTRQSIEGTSEPASAYDDDLDGCYFSHNTGGTTWAMPGEGFVEIREVPGGDYYISFSFEDPKGYNVSGEYTGEINGYASASSYGFAVAPAAPASPASPASPAAPHTRAVAAGHHTRPSL